MFTDKIKLAIDVNSGIGGYAANTRFILLTLITLTLLISFAIMPTSAQADGLFDFQMKLAKKGNAEAEYKVGEMYETGFGVKEDKTEAMNWITKAANQGHETAGFKLLYWDIEKNGMNTANKDKVDALKAKAKSGNAQAEYYIGKMHARGVGMKKNPDKALQWLNKAALVGVLEAEREIILVREDKRNQALKRQRANEKKQAELKARQEKERLAKQEQQRKLQQQKKAEAKARSEELAKQNKAAAEANGKADKESAEKAKLLAKKEAEAKAKQTTKAEIAAKKQREAQKKALMKKRAADEKARKAKFESDPCSGKSARFLSTCK